MTATEKVVVDIDHYGSSSKRGSKFQEEAKNLSISVRTRRSHADTVALLSEKVNDTEKQLAEQKEFYEGKMKQMEEHSQAELAALKSQSDEQMNEVMDGLKADIAAKNEALSANQEEITRLQAGLSEEKVNNDGLTNKTKALEEEV